MRFYGFCSGSPPRRDEEHNEKPHHGELDVSERLIREAHCSSKKQSGRHPSCGRHLQSSSKNSRIDTLARCLRKQRIHARNILGRFLQKNGFQHDVNSKKYTRLGLKHTFPLHTAVCQKNAEVVQLLLDCRADTSVRDSSGYTAWQLAVKDPDRQVIACFEQRQLRKKVLWQL
ncbi:unnamed protein product [Effrenium voratum]|nr:unnamed protein product [Effrenium voratum]CAJ1429012.1 unnamed protein product [Effrenium voratum]|mmetsp:Transcript_107042/g.255564  ORF Transcript_107042/g.255564 Transcript_107042/m.255564 type:complete len:173 (+) Transcript_107042:58-576(+)